MFVIDEIALALGCRGLGFGLDNNSTLLLITIQLILDINSTLFWTMTI